MLQLVVAEGFRLPEQEYLLRRQSGAAVHDSLDGVHQVIHVHERLAMCRGSGVEPAREVSFVNALNLVHERN